MIICNYQDELLADLAVQPAQILDKIEACNKRTRVNVLWKLDNRFTFSVGPARKLFWEKSVPQLSLFTAK